MIPSISLRSRQSTPNRQPIDPVTALTHKLIFASLFPRHSRRSGSTESSGSPRYLRSRLGSLVILTAALLWGSMALDPTVFAQTTLDVNTADQQANPTIPPLSPNLRVIYVDSVNGSDTQGNGSQASPFKTITYATQQAAAGTVIQLLPGQFTAESGEVFPIILKSGQILRGDESNLGERHQLIGGADYVSVTMSRQNVLMLAETGSEIRGVTMRNEGRRGYALWLESAAPKVYANSFVGNVHDGIFLTGESNAWIEGNRFYQNGANGISILGTSRPTVVNNLFQETGFGIIVDQKSAPEIRDNRIIRNRSGVVAGGTSQPKLRNNLISENLAAGFVAITQSQPDLGTAQDPGNNVFEGNGELAIHNSTRGGIQLIAYGNSITGDTKGAVDTSGQATLASTPSTAPGTIASGSVSLPTAPTAATTPAPTTGSQPTGSQAEGSQPTAAQPTGSQPTGSQPSGAQATGSQPTESQPDVVSPTLPAASNPGEQIPTASSPSATVPPTLPTLAPTPPASVANSAPTSSQPSPSTPTNSSPSIVFEPVPFSPSEPSGSGSSEPAGSPPASPQPVAAEPQATPTPELIDITTLIPVGSRNPQTASSGSTESTGSTSSSSLPEPPTLSAANPSPAPTASPTVTANQPAAQFRVLVTPTGDNDLGRLQQLIPTAQPITFNGRNVFQAGLYDNRQTAQAVLDQLLEAGFEAIAEIIFAQ